MVISIEFVSRRWTPISGQSTRQSLSSNTGQLAVTEALLQACGLPHEDCHKHIDNFIGIFDNNNLIASGGIETLGEYGLLRSVAVQDRFRGRGLARQIVDRLHEQARNDGLKALYFAHRKLQRLISRITAIVRWTGMHCRLL